MVGVRAAFRATGRRLRDAAISTRPTPEARCVDVADDLTDSACIPDFLGIAGNTSGRISRTGDQAGHRGRESEYQDRIDLQVEIRGRRIDLEEIESALRHVPGVTATVLDRFEPTSGIAGLVGYYCGHGGSGSGPEPTAISSHLRERLPYYMTPAHFEHLGDIPMTPPNKVDRRALPHPATGSGPPRASPASRSPDLLVHLIATVCAIVVGLVLAKQGFDRLALVLDRWGVVETALAVLVASALAGLLCVLVPLMRRLIRRCNNPRYPELPDRRRFSDEENFGDFETTWSPCWSHY